MEEKGSEGLAEGKEKLGEEQKGKGGERNGNNALVGDSLMDAPGHTCK